MHNLIQRVMGHLNSSSYSQFYLLKVKVKVLICYSPILNLVSIWCALQPKPQQGTHATLVRVITLM